MESLIRSDRSGIVAILERNLSEVAAQIRDSALRAGRPPEGVKLLPVVKSVGPEIVQILYEMGIRDVAENRVQVAQEKRSALSGLKGLRWHLVGHLQRNKVRKAVAIFDSVHSLDSIRLAEKMEEELALVEGADTGGGDPGPGEAHLPGKRAPLLFVEIHNGIDAAKGGVPPEEAAPFIRELRRFPRVSSRIAGLMVMAPDRPDPEAARPHFRKLRDLRDGLAADGLIPPGAGLSMGMSGDFPIAVEEGATVVRVGTRLFQGIGEGRAAAAREPEE